MPKKPNPQVVANAIRHVLMSSPEVGKATHHIENYRLAHQVWVHLCDEGRECSLADVQAKLNGRGSSISKSILEMTGIQKTPYGGRLGTDYIYWGMNNIKNDEYDEPIIGADGNGMIQVLIDGNMRSEHVSELSYLVVAILCGHADHPSHAALWPELLDAYRVQTGAAAVVSNICTLGGVHRNDFRTKVHAVLATRRPGLEVHSQRSNRVWAVTQLLNMHRTGSITLRGLVDIDVHDSPIWESNVIEPAGHIVSETPVTSDQTAGSSPLLATSMLVGITIDSINSDPTQTTVNADELQTPFSTVTSRMQQLLQPCEQTPQPNAFSSNDKDVAGCHSHQFDVHYSGCVLSLTIFELPYRNIFQEEQHSRHMLQTALAVMRPALLVTGGTLFHPDPQAIVDKYLLQWARQHEDFFKSAVRRLPCYQTGDDIQWWTDFIDTECIKPFNPDSAILSVQGAMSIPIGPIGINGPKYRVLLRTVTAERNAHARRTVKLATKRLLHKGGQDVVRAIKKRKIKSAASRLITSRQSGRT